MDVSKLLYTSANALIYDGLARLRRRKSPRGRGCSTDRAL